MVEWETFRRLGGCAEGARVGAEGVEASAEGEMARRLPKDLADGC